MNVTTCAGRRRQPALLSRTAQPLPTSLTHLHFDGVVRSLIGSLRLSEGRPEGSSFVRLHPRDLHEDSAGERRPHSTSGANPPAYGHDGKPTLHTLIHVCRRRIVRAARLGVSLLQAIAANLPCAAGCVLSIQ